MLDQLSFELPELADDRLEQLLIEEIARDGSNPGYHLILIPLDREGFGDAA